MSQRSPGVCTGAVNVERCWCVRYISFSVLSPAMIRFTGTVGPFGESPGAVRPCAMSLTCFGLAPPSSLAKEQERAREREAKLEREARTSRSSTSHSLPRHPDFIIVHYVHPGVCARSTWILHIMYISVIRTEARVCYNFCRVHPTTLGAKDLEIH